MGQSLRFPMRAAQESWVLCREDYYQQDSASVSGRNRLVQHLTHARELCIREAKNIDLKKHTHTSAPSLSLVYESFSERLIIFPRREGWGD